MALTNFLHIGGQILVRSHRGAHRPLKACLKHASTSGWLREQTTALAIIHPPRTHTQALGGRVTMTGCVFFSTNLIGVDNSAGINVSVFGGELLMQGIVYQVKSRGLGTLVWLVGVQGGGGLGHGANPGTFVTTSSH
jgi:hypothetical protein